MKNLLSLLAALGLTATAATTVIACGSPKNSVIIKKTALKDLNLKTRLKNSVKNQQAAFDSFIELNLEVSDLRDDVQVIGFNAPDYNQEGSLEVQAKTNTKYSGTLTITIPESNRTNIARLVTNTTIQGTENMTAEEAFQAVLTANSSWTNLSEYVNYNDDSYVASSFTTNGSLTITANPNTEYTGSIEITILAIKQIALSSLNQTSLDGKEAMTTNDALIAFLTNNPNASDLEQYVSVTFDAPDYDKAGSLIITAAPDTKYTGTIRVTINALVVIDLGPLADREEFILDIDGTSAMMDDASGEVALKEFFDINAEKWPDFAQYIKVVSYQNVTYSHAGILRIQGTGKYSGEIGVFIRQISVTDEDIVDTIINSGSIKFSATKALNQTLASFINGVLRSGEHDDSHWYLKGQIEPHKDAFPILNFIDYDKYEFIGFYLSDETTPLTDAYLQQNSQVGVDMQLRAKFNYGTVHDKFIDFSLSIKEDTSLDETNFVDVVKTLSQNGQLILHIPSGTDKMGGSVDSTYAKALRDSFIQLVQSLGYKINLKDMEVTQQWLPGLNGGTDGEAPNDAQLNSDYYHWYSTKGISIGGYMDTLSGSRVNFEFRFLQCEIIIGQEK